ncbi:hypothetical protein RUND412_002839 [Rhizina undulata]
MPRKAIIPSSISTLGRSAGIAERKVRAERERVIAEALEELSDVDSDRLDDENMVLLSPPRLPVLKIPQRPKKALSAPGGRKRKASGTGKNAAKRQKSPASDIPSSFSDVPNSDVPYSNIPSSDIPSSDVPSSDVPSSVVPTSNVPISDVHSSDLMPAEYHVSSGSSNSAELSEADFGLPDDEKGVISSPPRPPTSSPIAEQSETATPQELSEPGSPDIDELFRTEFLDAIESPESSHASFDISSFSSSVESDEIEELASGDDEPSPSTRVMFSRYQTIRRISPENHGKKIPAKGRKRRYSLEEDRATGRPVAPRRACFQLFHSASAEETEKGLGVYRRIKEEDFEPGSETQIVVYFGEDWLEGVEEIPVGIRVSENDYA